MLGRTKLLEEVERVPPVEFIVPPIFAILIVMSLEPILTFKTFGIAELSALSGIAPPAQLLAVPQLPELPPTQFTEDNWVIVALVVTPEIDWR